MTKGLLGERRSWAPGVVVIDGSFAVSGGAITSTRPVNIPGWKAAYKAAGVYVVTLDETLFQSVLDSVASVAPDTGSTGALPSAPPGQVVISKGFLSTNAAGTQFAADTTNSQLVILAFNAAGNALADPSSSYRISFAIALSEDYISR